MLTAKPQDKKFQDADHNLQLSRVMTPKSNISVQQAPAPAPITQTKKVVQRSQTDAGCFAFFVVVQIVSIGIGLLGFIDGDPSRLAKPYDPDHRACGVDSGVEEYPFIFFATPEDKFLYRTVCVKECPNAQTTMLLCATNSVVSSCKVNPSVNNLTEAVLVYDTVECTNPPHYCVVSSVCLPTTQYYYLQLQGNLYPGTLQQAASDANNSKLSIAIAALVGLGISFAVLLLGERFAGFIVWAFVVLFTILCFAAGIISIKIYSTLSNPPDLSGPDTAQISSDDLEASTISQNSLEKVFLAVAAITLVLGCGTILVALCFRKRIQLTIMMVKVAADFVKTNTLVNAVPLSAAALIFAYTTWWLCSALFLFSAMPVTRAVHQLPFTQTPGTPAYLAMAGFHLFAYIWYLCFAIGCAEFVLTGAVADWYYRQGNDRFNTTIHPVAEAWNRLKGYHFGSVALGSGLIALVSPLRFMLEYLHKLMKIDARSNPALGCVKSFCCCCLWVYDSCINMLSKYTYVIVTTNNNHKINTSGLDFFPSARQAVEIIEKDLATFVLVGGLGEIFTMVGRLFIGSLSACLCFSLAMSHGALMPYVPAIICFVINDQNKQIIIFTVSSVFMSVYGMSAEAIYLVYMHSQQFVGDEEIPQSTYQFQSFLAQAQQLQ